MNFIAEASPLSPEGLEDLADRMDIGVPALWAVLTVETRGCGFLPDRRPTILFERHVFRRLTGAAFDATVPDLSHTKAGGYGAEGDHQYRRLERAMALDETAALKSTSWGLGQVMGFNAHLAGFDSVQQLVRACCSGEDGQLRAMAGFIEHEGLGGLLRQADWKGFARRYNGVDFQKNRYDTKLAQAHARFKVGPLPDLTVRWVQLALRLLGHAAQVGAVDGWYGRNTQKALQAFQAARGLPVSGEPDAMTMGVLSAALGWPID
ncbi:MAG: N-acetylmuramidase domain-containing protein [Aquabacterium sp.]